MMESRQYKTLLPLSGHQAGLEARPFPADPGQRSQRAKPVCGLAGQWDQPERWPWRTLAKRPCVSGPAAHLDLKLGGAHPPAAGACLQHRRSPILLSPTTAMGWPKPEPDGRAGQRPRGRAPWGSACANAADSQRSGHPAPPLEAGARPRWKLRNAAPSCPRPPGISCTGWTANRSDSPGRATGGRREIVTFVEFWCPS